MSKHAKKSTHLLFPVRRSWTIESLRLRDTLRGQRPWGESRNDTNEEAVNRSGSEGTKNDGAGSVSGALDSGLRVALEIDADHDPGTGGTGGSGGMLVAEDFDIIEDSFVRQNNANNS